MLLLLWDVKSYVWDSNRHYVIRTSYWVLRMRVIVADEMLSLTYEITTALSHTDELISPPYDIAIVTISYGQVTKSPVWDTMMSKKNMRWPFYATVLPHLFSRKSKKTSKLRVTARCVWNSPVTGELPAQRASNAVNLSIRWRLHDANTSHTSRMRACCYEFVYDHHIR